MWFVTGADARVLCEPTCPESERTKFASIGAAMCLTTCLAFLSGLSAFYQIFFPGLHQYDFLGTPLRAAPSLLFAVIWTLVIFNMQRLIMFSSRRVSSHRRVGLIDWLHVLPGAVLSLAVALTVATPLQVLVLAPEIDLQLITDRHAEKAKVHTAIARRYEVEKRALVERDIMLRERSGAALALTTDDGPACLLPSNADGNSSETCLQQVEAWQADIDQKMAQLKRRYSSEHEQLALDQRWLALQQERHTARMARERLYADITLDQQAGLLKRAGIAYEVNRLFSWVLFLVVCFIQSVPVVIRALSPKGPYDDLLELVSRRHLAAAGIEPKALCVFDRRGRAYPVNRYLMADEKEKNTRAALLLQRQALRQQRLACYEARYSAILRTDEEYMAGHPTASGQ